MFWTNVKRAKKNYIREERENRTEKIKIKRRRKKKNGETKGVLFRWGISLSFRFFRKGRKKEK